MSARIPRIYKLTVRLLCTNASVPTLKVDDKTVAPVIVVSPVMSTVPTKSVAPAMLSMLLIKAVAPVIFTAPTRSVAPATLSVEPAATAPLIVVSPVMSTVPTKSVAPATLRVLDKEVASKYLLCQLKL